MSFTLCSSGAIVYKAGFYVNSDLAASGAVLQQLADEAEAYACNVARYDVVTNYGSLTENGKKIYQQLASDYAGKKLIYMDMSGFTNTIEAQAMIATLNDDIKQITNIIQDEKSRQYLGVS
jgi:hypothetical protein